MDNTVCKQALSVVRKVMKKKKRAKDKLDSVKRADKKKRRLERALATSAAIVAELEKKKLEEQRRLDEEGAAITESFALHVRLGEDSDDSSSRVMLGGQRCSSHAVQGIGFVSGLGDSNMVISTDLVAAKAFSSLQLSENA